MRHLPQVTSDDYTAPLGSGTLWHIKLIFVYSNIQIGVLTNLLQIRSKLFSLVQSNSLQIYNLNSGSY